MNLAILFSAELADRFRRAYESFAGRTLDPWWDVDALLMYGESWKRFIPKQVAGRIRVDIDGMDARVEETLAGAVSRI